MSNVKIEKAKRLVEILNDNDFCYYEVEDILELSKNKDRLELTKKAYGDSKEVYIKDEFNDDYQELKQLAKALNIQLPSCVWYD